MRFEKVAQRLVTAINAGDYAGIQNEFGKIMKDALPREKSDAFFMNLTLTCGRIVKLDALRFTPPAQAVIPVHFERAVLDMKIVLDNEDRIIGLVFLPHVADVPVHEKNETPLALPCEGDWFVCWGGDTPEMNQHHSVPNQRFAFDLLGVDATGATHKGEGVANEDYFAFGRKVLAPADGVIVEVIEGVRDNTPGSMNPYSALGNSVSIQHAEHEVSVLAHLKRGTVTVKLGDRVKRGSLIGLCGNSGNSSEPHLHFHLQNTPIIQDGTGIKCFFERVVVTVNGKAEPRANYSPVKGDVVTREAGTSQ